MAKKMLNVCIHCPAHKLLYWFFFLYFKMLSVKQSKMKWFVYELIFSVICICICVEEVLNHMIEIDMWTYQWLLPQSDFFFLRSWNLPVWIHSNYCTPCYYHFPNYSWPVSPWLVLWRLLLILNKLDTLEINLNYVGELVFGVRVICKVLKVRSRNEGEGLEEASTSETTDSGTSGRQKPHVERSDGCLLQKSMWLGVRWYRCKEERNFCEINGSLVKNVLLSPFVTKNTIC